MRNWATACVDNKKQQQEDRAAGQGNVDKFPAAPSRMLLDPARHASPFLGIGSTAETIGFLFIAL
jgi:hypothetical protein